MIYTIRTEADGRMVIITPAGNVARTTASEPFVTTDAALADECLAYLNQSATWPAKPAGSQRMKSMWGTIR